jgi:hypothetical protein
MTRSASINLLAKWGRAATVATLAVIAGAGVAPAAASAAPAATARPPAIMAGVFQLQNWGGDFRCLTASPQGGPVTLAECDLDRENQRWWRTNANEFVPWQGAIGPFYCLSANSSNVVTLALCSGATEHVWTQENETMRNKGTGRCLTAGANDRLTTAPCSGADNQHWRLFGS